LDGEPAPRPATAPCAAATALWAYDYDGDGIKVAGNTRPCIRGEAIEFHDGRCVADYWF